MASVQRRGETWQARYRTPDGASRSKAFRRKVDAEQFLTSVEHQKLTGGYVDPSAGRVTVQSYAERWRSIQVHRPGTAAMVETHLRRHVYPALGHRELAAVRPSEVQAWVRGLSEILAPSTVELVYRYLAAVFKAAVEDQLITSSPCRNVKLPKVGKAKVEPISVEQVQGLIDGIDPRYRALVVLGAGSGLRQGEAFGLTVDRVDFLRRSVTVDRQRCW